MLNKECIKNRCAWFLETGKQMNGCMIPILVMTNAQLSLDIRGLRKEVREELVDIYNELVDIENKLR